MRPSIERSFPPKIDPKTGMSGLTRSYYPAPPERGRALGPHASFTIAITIEASRQATSTTIETIQDRGTAGS
jgi:hypothetical protein